MNDDEQIDRVYMDVGRGGRSPWQRWNGSFRRKVQCAEAMSGLSAGAS
jgi:hypothetical protein